MKKRVKNMPKSEEKKLDLISSFLFDIKSELSTGA